MPKLQCVISCLCAHSRWVICSLFPNRESPSRDKFEGIEQAAAPTKMHHPHAPQEPLLKSRKSCSLGTFLCMYKNATAQLRSTAHLVE